MCGSFLTPLKNTRVKMDSEKNWSLVNGEWRLAIGYLKGQIEKNVIGIDIHQPFLSSQPYSYPNPPLADPNDLSGNPL
jgi:hypothetical protein